MSVSAKEQIVSAFVELLRKKPLDKLSVTDIVRACGLTRQSFYYHFQDIPALITFIVCRYADDVGSRAAQAADLREAISIIFSHVWDCPDLVCQLTKSQKYPAKQIILQEIQGHMIRLFRHRRLDIGMGHLGMETTAIFYANAALGITMAYCKQEHVDREAFVEQIYRLVRGDMFQSQRPKSSKNQHSSQNTVYQFPHPGATHTLF